MNELSNVKIFWIIPNFKYNVQNINDYPHGIQTWSSWCQSVVNIKRNPRVEFQSRFEIIIHYIYKSKSRIVKGRESEQRIFCILEFIHCLIVETTIFRGRELDNNNNNTLFGSFRSANII